MWYSLNSQVERLDFMQIPEQDLDAVKKRLARAQGQLGGIIRMVDEGRDCTDVLTQLAAAQAAISKAAFTLISSRSARGFRKEEKWLTK
jgi:DNA-binding FrmR family transcriptional regulator